MKDALLLASSVGHAALLVWLALGRDRSVRARWLGALSADFFVWTLVTYFNHRQRSEFATMLDAATNALAIPLTLQFVGARVGAGYTYRFLSTLVGFFFIGLAASAVVAFQFERSDWVASRTWTHAMLTGLVVTTVMVATSLRRAYTLEPQPRERSLLALTAAAFVVGGAGLGGELLSDLGFALPQTGALGVLVATVLLALATIRNGAKAQRYLATALAALMTVAIAAGLYGIFRRFGTSTVAGAALGLAAAGILALLGRAALQSATTLRTRRRELALAGQMSAQMLHDLRNPLAALSGALDVIKDEAEDAELRAEMLEIAHAQAARLSSIVERYHRTLRVELRKVSFAPSELAEASLRAFRTKTSALQLRASYTNEVPLLRTLEGDPDLVASVLENLLRNAEEALEGRSGDVRLTLRSATRTGNAYAVFGVSDDGPGMDEEVRRLAGNDFFTTKASGSGLGLAFARRVAEAHGGALAIESRPNGGTRVELWLPLP